MVSLPVRRRTLDVVLALVAFALTLIMLGSSEFGGENARELDPAGVLIAAIASLPLAFLRRAPLALFALMSAATVTLNLVGYQSGPPPGPTIAIFLLAARADEGRSRSWLTSAVVIVAFLLHVASAGIAEDRIPPEALLFGTLVWGGAWVLGDRVRQRRARLGELEERVRRSEREAERERRLAAAEERTRIARDLHDSAGHAISVILVQAGAARLLQERDPARARAALQTIEEVARETVSEIDRLVRVLREDGAGRSRAAVEPPPGLAALPSLLERHRLAGLEADVTEAGERRALPPAVDQAAYRILQESLTNATRHGAGRTEVRLRFDEDALELTVQNPVAADVIVSQDGLGIVGMRERAALLGGYVETTIAGGVFTVHAQLPYSNGLA